jgi:hypothetical protein
VLDQESTPLIQPKQVHPVVDLFGQQGILEGKNAGIHQDICIWEELCGC